MSELLLELFSEEIPARMQAHAADDLQRLVTEGLKAQGLAVGEAQGFATPRRLALVVAGVPEKSPGVIEERKGPRVGAPAPAIQGFLKATGLPSIGEATVVSDAKKGDYYVARIERMGRAARDIIAEVVPDVMRKFPWPRSMRWRQDPQSSSFTWVRPLHSIVCLLGGTVVPFEIAGLKSASLTRGHRFHGNAPFAVESFADYRRQLRHHKVLLDANERAAVIAEQAHTLASEHKLRLVEDKALLAENAGLTEWPTVMMGHFDEAFLEVPAECLITAMKHHQKYFSLRHPKSSLPSGQGRLANRFLLVSNLKAKDGGPAIVAGNEKVIRARLADAKFFWEQDLKKKLEPMRFELKGITFHEKLGTQWERMERLTELSRQIAGAVDAEPEKAGRAAQLAKADLVSGMVGEFPELQGLMGRYYAEAEHLDPAIARAIEEHYKPKGQGDTVPTYPVSIAVALADKLDTLVGFWAIGEKPTGSGDPYQLRRAALGVIRIVLENDLRVSLTRFLRKPLVSLVVRQQIANEMVVARKLFEIEQKLGVTIPEEAFSAILEEVTGDEADEFVRRFTPVYVRVRDELLTFFADRLKVHLREQGARHDLIDAVFALGGQDDLALIVKRVEALGKFLETGDGEHLLTGVKRAQNIVAIEEKKDKRSYDGTAEPTLMKEPQEKALHAAVQSVSAEAAAAIQVENFAGAMAALAELRPPIDAFFDKVTVNDERPKLRENRLRLLSEIRTATLQVADFSKIAG